MAPEDRIPPIPPEEGARSPDEDDVLVFMGLRQVSEKQSEIEARRALEMIDVDITELRSPTPEEVSSGVRAVAGDQDERIEIIEGTSLDAMRKLAADESKTRPLVQPNITRWLTPREVAQVHTRLLARGLPSNTPPPTNVYMTNQGRYLYVYGLLADQGNMSRVHEALSIDPLDITRPYEVIVKEVADDEIKRAALKYTRDGTGGNVLGDPRIALTWLANQLSGLGIPLQKGQVVTTGTCMVPLELEPGDSASADYGLLGRVSMTFSD